MSRPVTIGLTLDFEQPGGYSKFPWYAIRENYCAAVVQVGGTPLLLPHEPGEIQHYCDLIDGLIVTGGAFDVDPALFGASHRHDSVVTKDRRTAFEIDLTRSMLAVNKPVFGICGGQQLLNVILGGSLIQHIPDEIEHPLAHEQPNPRNEPSHPVAITPDTMLRHLTKCDEIAVNSAHHQAVKDVGKGVVVNAWAPDGVIEGIEARSYRFCLGVQWHPEFFITPADEAIFRAFVAEAGNRL